MNFNPPVCWELQIRFRRQRSVRRSVRSTVVFNSAIKAICTPD